MSDFAHTHARTTDPHTSHMAAEQAEGLANAHRDLIANWLASISPGGGTVEDIASGTGLDHVQVGKRMSELDAEARAYCMGQKPLSSGRKGRVWYAFQ